MILFIVKSFTEFSATTKEKLKSQGYEISNGGVSVHTQKKMDREDYIDATRGYVPLLTSHIGEMLCRLWLHLRHLGVGLGFAFDWAYVE